MTTISMALKRLLDKAGSEEFLRSALENILQLLMDTDVSGQIKAAWHERTPDRGNYRNGYRERRLVSGVGELLGMFPNCCVVHTSRSFWSLAA